MNIDNNTVVIGGLYRHFKGGVYQVLQVATDEAERTRKLVIYQNVSDGTVWAREIGLFLSDRDTEKYPDYEQVERLKYIGRINK